jgi:hypothetical protein
MTPIYMPCLRGLGGHFSSSGVDTLAAKAALIPGVTTEVFNYRPEHLVLDRVLAHRGGNLGVMGFSLGGNDTTPIAQQLAERGLRLKLLICEDATILARMRPILGNVDRAICFHNNDLINGPVGHAELTAGTDFDPTKQQLITIQISMFHLHVDQCGEIMEYALFEIARASV